jgi:hypothetical protein
MQTRVEQRISLISQQNVQDNQVDLTDVDDDKENGIEDSGIGDKIHLRLNNKNKVLRIFIPRVFLIYSF